MFIKKSYAEHKASMKKAAENPPIWGYVKGLEAIQDQFDYLMRQGDKINQDSSYWESFARLGAHLQKTALACKEEHEKWIAYRDTPYTPPGEDKE